MKRIVICCDGTWNTPDKQEGGVPIATNVVKIAEAVCPQSKKDGAAQLIYYDPGVGTSGNWFKRTYDGATGAGLARNILEAYRYLSRNYEWGDELFFFGFSRGAYTVRSLVGLIRNSGILRPNYLDMVHQAFRLYRKGAKSTHPAQREATLFRHTYAFSDITPVKFIGVWDTVGSLGNPLLLNGIISRRYRFHDTDLSSTVANACQALAIDEKRRQFRATMWHQQKHTDRQKQKIEQVWFIGAHSDVGGGYPSAGLSDFSLEWMFEKARECDLELQPLPPLPKPILEEKPKESRSWLYPLSWLFPSHRPIAKPDAQKGPTYESLHPSVLQRYQQDPSYRPKNLEEFFKRRPDKKPVGV